MGPHRSEGVDCRCRRRCSYFCGGLLLRLLLLLLLLLWLGRPRWRRRRAPLHSSERVHRGVTHCHQRVDERSAVTSGLGGGRSWSMHLLVLLVLLVRVLVLLVVVVVVIGGGVRGPA